MPARLWAASALVAVCISGAAPAFAADISDPYYPPRAAAPYDDQRYGDVYGHPPPPSRYAEPRYEGPRYGESYRPRPTYRDEPAYRDENGYLEPFSPPRRFSGRYFDAPHRDADCIPRHEIKRRLVEEGWTDFSSPELRGEVGVIHARRPSGGFYRLKIDRCSGEILNARMIEGTGYGHYTLGHRFHGRSY